MTLCVPLLCPLVLVRHFACHLFTHIHTYIHRKRESNELLDDKFQLEMENKNFFFPLDERSTGEGEKPLVMMTNELMVDE